MGKKRAGEEAYRPPAAPDAPAKTPTGLSQVAIVAIVGYVMLAASVLVQLGTQHVVPIHSSPAAFAGMRATGALAARTLAHVEPHNVDTRSSSDGVVEVVVVVRRDVAQGGG